MKNFKRLGALALALVLCLSLSVTAFAAGENIINDAGTTGTTPVNLTAAPLTFKVTVPTVLPVAVNNDGAVTCADSGTAKIINEGAGAVIVTNLAVAGINSWATRDYDDFASTVKTTKVGTKAIALTIGAVGQTAEKTTGADTISFTQANWPAFDAVNATDSDELPLAYGAIVAPQAVPISDAAVTNVIFTIDWDAVV